MMFMSMLWDTIFQISDTYELAQVFLIDNHIPALRFGTADKPSVFAAGFGAEEWQASVLLLRFFEQLLQNCRDSRSMAGIAVKKALKKRSIIIVPTVCPEKMQKGEALQPHDTQMLEQYLRFHHAGTVFALAQAKRCLYSPAANRRASTHSETIMKILHTCSCLPVCEQADGVAAEFCQSVGESTGRPAFLISPASLDAAELDSMYRALEETLVVAALL